MTEEQVTKFFLKILIENNWEIISYDFPQSGTGRLLHPDDNLEEDVPSINPDIVAYKDYVCLFFENKDRYYLDDFKKINILRTRNYYDCAIKKLLNGRKVNDFYFGIGLPSAKYKNSARINSFLVDFVFGVSESFDLVDLYNPLFLKLKS